MTSTLTVTMLPADEGDAIELRWGDHLAFIDMGRKGTGERIAAALAAAGKPVIELVVVTHVDFDHIGGALSGLVDKDSPIADIVINDIWFNGYRHLRPEVDAAVVSQIESYGVQHGFELETWLEATGRHWNRSFGGGPVTRVPGEPPRKIPFPGGLNVWVIGPEPRRLEAIEPHWRDVVLEEAERPDELPQDLESYGGEIDVALDDRFDLENLAATENGKDTVANGTSIALIVEWHGNRLLLAGDAYPEDLVAGVRATDGSTTHFDLVKLPHHGSKNNATQLFTDTITADCWAVSTNGSRHHHPDPAAIARILLSNLERAEGMGCNPAVQRLAFNVRSDENAVWDNDEWAAAFSYAPEYGSDEAGLSLTLAPKPEKAE